MIATGSARPFVRRPCLPLVPPPHTGESLSGWIEAISGTYGFGWREFLQTLRIKPPARLRSLNIDPPWPSLLALEEQTGVAAAFMRDHMTFEQLSTHMAWFVHEAAPCRACAAYKRPGDARQIEWLDDLAPWQFVCDRHPCPTLANEVGRSGMRDTIDRDVKALQNCLRSTACSKVRWPFPSVPMSTAMCIDMVAAINSRLRLRVQAQNGADRIVFAVDDILMARQIDEDARPWPRNSRAVSAWYAWHVLACPEIVLHRQTRCRDADQTYDLLAVLFDFRHTSVFNERWEYALGLCARADAGPDASAAERKQVRLLHDPIFRSLRARKRQTNKQRAVHH
jgi:hypothetical protein